MHIYERLKDLREDSDLNQKQVAEYLNIKQQQYSEYERGKREMPMRYYIEIARFYKVSLDYIVGLTHDKRKFW